MRVAGLGFRASATAASLRAALAAAGAADADALATLAEKADAPVLTALAETLRLPVIAVPAAALAGIATLTNTPRQQALFGTGSLAEAVALHAAGPGARLRAPRVISPDGLATAAIAERSSP